MISVFPSILTSDPSELKRLINLSEEVVDRVQIDIIDGVFVNNKTIDPTAISYIETNLKMDFHLMVKEPINWIEKCMNVNADRIIGQIEMMNSQEEFVDNVISLNTDVGIAIDIDTDISKIDKNIFHKINAILVLSVKAGFGGQPFEIKALEKIKELYKIRELGNFEFLIQDDGGITFDYIDDTLKAGVDEVFIGQRIFNGNLKQNIDEFIKKAYEI